MDVKDAIEARRAYRSLAPVEVTEQLLHELADAAHKAPSCNNNQPWRFVFVHGRDQLERMREALSKGNAWAKDGSLIIAVLSRREYDCTPPDRDLYMFDTGLATAHLILRATELGLLAHPIVGYDAQKVREVLGVPAELVLIALIIVGRRADQVNPALQPWQVERDEGPRVRKPLDEVVHVDAYHPEQEKWAPKPK